MLTFQRRHVLLVVAEGLLEAAGLFELQSSILTTCSPSEK